MYSPSGALNFPVPILSYAWNPSDNFHLNIGLPLALMWKPVDDLTLDLSYTPLTNVNALATYRLSDQLRLYGGYQNLTESYFLADRVNTSDRFFGLEERLVTGVKWDLLRNLKLDVNGGYAFDRRYGEGRNQTSGLYDRVDVSSGAFLGLKLNWKF
jgi:outer membrane receptor for monomeric catechols